HQWLIAAATPAWPGIPSDRYSIVDGNGFPNATYPQYTPPSAVRDSAGTQQCGVPTTNPNVACGDYAVNTIQPAYQPFRGSPQLPAQTGPTIGDRLSAGGVSWAWYSGGWSNADGDVNAPGWTNGTTFGVCGDPDSSLNGSDLTTAKWYCPNKVFQFHHQPFNYYANYAPGTPARGSRRWSSRSACADSLSLTTPSTTRPRSWRPSSIATDWRRSARATGR